jgi:hypothetical protein
MLAALLMHKINCEMLLADEGHATTPLSQIAQMQRAL